MKMITEFILVTWDTIEAYPFELYLILVAFSFILFIITLIRQTPIVALFTGILNFVTALLTPISVKTVATSSEVIAVVFPHTSPLMYIFIAMGLASIFIFIYRMFVAPLERFRL
ncbi:MAG: hypothetical protein DRO01_01085 [Thermoproteota archaeon]|nr:MAG: hypothetical protein DRO01_01085 [Candidatus Korarchaeota archaeon]